MPKGLGDTTKRICVFVWSGLFCFVFFFWSCFDFDGFDKLQYESVKARTKQQMGNGNKKGQGRSKEAHRDLFNGGRKFSPYDDRNTTFVPLIHSFLPL